MPAESIATGSTESVMVEEFVAAVMERRSPASVRMLLGLERRLSCTASDSPVVRASEIWARKSLDCEAMLYAAARAQHVSEVIEPALAAGKVVICDRFVDSSIAYQGYGRKLGEAVAVINGYAVKGCMPDLTLLFKLDPSVGKDRIRVDQQDRLDAEAEAFHQDVYRGYLQLEKQFADRFCGIDASRSIAEISTEVCTKLDRILAAWESRKAGN